jgi:hypothetical protein
VLNNLDKKTIAREIGRLPKTMDLLQVLDNRQLVDGNISSSFWSKLGAGDRTAFVDTTRYLMRTFLKEQLEKKAGSEIVSSLNGKIGLAMDVRHLSAMQQAIRIKGSIPGSGKYLSIGRLVGNLLDKTIFSPAVRTRYAQGLTRMGEKAGSTLGRNIITEQIVNPVIE